MPQFSWCGHQWLAVDICSGDIFVYFLQFFFNFLQLVFFLQKTALVLFLTFGEVWKSPCVSRLCCLVITDGPEISFFFPAERVVIPTMLQPACGFKGRERIIPWSEAPSFLLFPFKKTGKKCKMHFFSHKTVRNLISYKQCLELKSNVCYQLWSDSSWSISKRVLQKP